MPANIKNEAKKKLFGIISFRIKNPNIVDQTGTL
tara:strand:+ start:750 stop:851 length:102 start_codon:yes stop_codon:yes gene_type:complete